MDKEESPLKQIRTFQGDVAEALARQRESLVTIQRAELLRKNTARPNEKTALETSKRKKDLFFLYFGSFILIALGFIGSWYAYNEYLRKASTPIIIAPANRFISTDTEINLGFSGTSRESLINALSGSAENIPNEKLGQITLRNGSGNNGPLLLTSELLDKLKSRAPGSLVRSFNPLFMYGAFGKSVNTGLASTFLIIKLDSFENAFAGMLTWEKNISQDIGPLFATASLLKNVPPESAFVDVIDRNKDIRMLEIDGRSALLYTFLDNNMLIITDNIETLRILLDRLTREKLSR